MGNLAIIPARGGSKRIPRKNIKDFLGKPIIAYSIEAAINSALFDEVMVSTDDEEIAEVAMKYGAVVPFIRSKENANDYAGTAAVLVEVLNEYRKRSREFSSVCCIYPTAPLLSIEALRGGFNKLVGDGHTSVFPIVEFSFPIWRGLAIDEEDKTQMVWPENLNMRSQDLKKVYHDAGQWYWLDANRFLSDPKLYTDNSSYILCDEMEVQDIDNLADWKLAELKYVLKQK